MQHCQKIYGGRSPPVTTKEEWENLTREVDLVTQDLSVLPGMWLSATEGDKDLMLAHLDYWNVTETIWRDFYTGTRLLDTWTKPYYSRQGDARYEDTHNCMGALTDGNWDRSWFERKCYVYGPSSCPCSSPTQVLLRLRGLCKKSLIEKDSAKKQFSP